MLPIHLFRTGGTLCLFGLAGLAGPAYVFGSPSALHPRYPRGSVCLFDRLKALQESESALASTQPQERTAELEIPLGLVLSHLTTDDGTLGPLAPAENPGALRELTYGKSPKDILWSSLTAKQKAKALSLATEGQSFFRKRRIQGLRLKAGDHPFQAFQPYVELGAPSDAGDLRTVELHLRQGRRASDVALATRKAARAAGRARVPLHVHLPFPLRSERLRSSPLIEPAKHADFVRRLELFSQMASVLETNVDLSVNQTASTVNFTPMAGPHKLDSIHAAFFRSASGLGMRVYTKDYVGVRGEGFYDRSGLWGVEVRALHGSYSDSTVSALLEGFESSGASPDFGYAGDRVARWLAQAGIRAPTDSGPVDLLEAASIHERSIAPIMMSQYPRYDAAVIRPEGLSPAEEAAWEPLSRAKEPPGNRLKLIMHDWPRDLLFYDNPMMQERIRAARISAMRKALRGDPMQLVTREFLLDSGIAEAFGRSLGVRIDILAR